MIKRYYEKMKGGQIIGSFNYWSRSSYSLSSSIYLHLLLIIQRSKTSVPDQGADAFAVEYDPIQKHRLATQQSGQFFYINDFKNSSSLSAFSFESIR